MAEAQIRWKPFGAVSTQTIDFASFGLQRMQGGHESDRELTPTPAGRAVVIWHDSFDRYEIHCDAIHRIDNSLQFLQLNSFLPYAQAGGEFEFRGDGAKASATTLSTNAAEAATSLTVVSASGISAGDTIVVEHATDPRSQLTMVTGPPSGGTFNISPFLYSAMPSGSAVRHFQFFARCRADAASFVERDAGLGAHLWDFRMRFRTFRG